MSLNSVPLFTSGGAPIRFTVDDVAASTERLPTAELLALVCEKVRRPVLLSPLAGRSVVNTRGISPNPLVAAIHAAFSRHLPLTLSPDAIWLTVVQGFSHHVNEHAEALRGRLVGHQGRRTLRERINNMTIEDVSAAVAGFSLQIRDATDPALHDALLCDFTTTTPEMRVASEVALMDTYSPYFEFLLELCICGIPHITLTGCVQDWQRIRDRIEVFETFGLDWWVSRLRPILDEFVRAAEGRPDREFWRAIYKFRPEEGPYHPASVTGWLVDLFPYLGEVPRRRRNHVFDGWENRGVALDAFPAGLCSVGIELELQDDDRQVIDTKKLDLVAGLLGVEQAGEDVAVSPTISWCLADRAPARPEYDKATRPGRPARQLPPGWEPGDAF